MPTPLDISAYIPVDGVTVFNAASVSTALTKLQNAYDSHVANVAVGGYGPDGHQTGHIAVPAASVNTGTTSADAATTLDVLLDQIATRIRVIEGGSTDWALGTAPTSLTAVNTAIAGHTIVAASAATATTATTATALAAPASIKTTLSDYLAAPGSVGQITIAAGGAWEDSNLAHIAALPQQTANLPAQPSGTNIQYVALSLAPTTGAPVATGGAVGASPARPAYPVGNKSIGMVTWRGATTLPTGIVAAADIEDARFGGGSGSGGGGVSGVASTAAFISNGNLIATYANSVDMAKVLNSSWSPASGVTNILKRIQGGASDAALWDMIQSSINGPYLGCMVANGTTIVLSVASGQIAVDGGALGARVFATATIAGGASTLTTVAGSAGSNGVASAAGGQAGVWGVYADFGVAAATWAAGGAAITLVSPTLVAGANLVRLASVLFDGTQFRSGTLSYTGQSTLTGDKVSPITFETALSPTTNFLTNTLWQTMPGASTYTLYSAVPLKGHVWVMAEYVTGATAYYFDLGLYVDGALQNYQYHGVQQAVTTTISYPLYVPFGAGTGNILAVASGGHLFQPAAKQGGFTTTNSIQNAWMRGEFWAA